MAKKITPETPDQVAIVFDRPGVQRIGDYLPNKVYQVNAAEAERLVSVKGFRYADPEPDPAAAEAAAE